MHYALSAIINSLIVCLYLPCHIFQSASLESTDLPSSNDFMTSRQTCHPARSFTLCSVIVLNFSIKISRQPFCPDAVQSGQHLRTNQIPVPIVDYARKFEVLQTLRPAYRTS